MSLTPTYVGSGTAVATADSVVASTTLTPPLPSGIESGDVLLCYTVCRSRTPTVAQPSGWGTLFDIQADSSHQGRLTVFYRVVTGSESAPSVAWSDLTEGTSGSPAIAVIAAFRNMAVSGSAPVTDVLGTASYIAPVTTTTGSAGGAAITTTVNNDLVISFTMRLDDAGSFSMLTGDVSWSTLNTYPTTSGADMVTAMCFGVKATAGSVAAKTFTAPPATPAPSIGVMVALKVATANNVSVGQAVETDSTLNSIYYFVPTAKLAADWPALRIELGHAASPNTPLNSIAWQDITNYVRGFTITRGKSHELEPAQAGTATITLSNRDRRFEPEYILSPYAGDIIPLIPIQIRAVWDEALYPIFVGFVEEWPVTWGVKDSQVTITAVDLFEPLNQAILNQEFDSAQSGQRVNDVLDLIGLSADNRDIEAGTSTIPGTTVASTSALTHLLDVGQSELGLLHIGKDGKLRFLSRDTLNTSTSMATYGDLPGDVPYKSLVFSFSKNEIRNDVQVTGASGAVYLADDSDSITDFGLRSYAISVLLADTDAETLAGYLLSFYAQPHSRINSLTVDPRDAPDLLWPLVLGHELGDRITIRRTPDETGSIMQDRFIEGLIHSVTQGATGFRWSTTITTGLPLVSTMPLWQLETDALDDPTHVLGY